jgi:hypothetical protein
MADPTLKDVLDAIAILRAETKEDLRGVEARLEAKIEAHRRETSEHRRETAKGFVDLDRELAGHADPVHRKLEEEMAELRKLVTAKKAARPAAHRPRRG